MGMTIYKKALRKRFRHLSGRVNQIVKDYAAVASTCCHPLGYSICDEDKQYSVFLEKDLGDVAAISTAMYYKILWVLLLGFQSIWFFCKLSE